MTLGAIAKVIEAELHGDASHVIRGICDWKGLKKGGENMLAWQARPLEDRAFLSSSVRSMIVSGLPAPEFLEGKDYLVVEDPGYAFTLIGREFHPLPRAIETMIHETAVIDETALLEGPVEIGAFCVVGARARIAKGSVLQSHVSVGADCSVGEDSVLEPFVTLLPGTRIGKCNHIVTGARLGVAGFGNPSKKGRFLRFPHIGVLVTEDEVQVGANACVARAALRETVLEEGVRIDNLVQVAHNCKVGAHTGIGAHTGLAGAVEIGKRCEIEAQAAFFGHQTVADDTVILGQSGVYSDVSKPGTYLGTPIRPAKDTHRITLATPKLPDLIRRVRHLEKALSGTDPED